jgi:hypothetical protein
MEPKLLDPGTLERPFPGRAHCIHALPVVRKTPPLVIAVNGSQSQYCIPVQGKSAAVSGLGGTSAGCEFSDRRGKPVSRTDTGRNVADVTASKIGSRGLIVVCVRKTWHRYCM